MIRVWGCAWAGPQTHVSAANAGLAAVLIPWGGVESLSPTSDQSSRKESKTGGEAGFGLI